MQSYIEVRIQSVDFPVLHSCYVQLELTGLGVFFAGLCRRKETRYSEVRWPVVILSFLAIPGSASRTSTRSPHPTIATPPPDCYCGKHAEEETPDAAAERDLNVTQYLLEEKGIDPSRRRVHLGDRPGNEDQFATSS